MDVGQPKDYITGWSHLKSRANTAHTAGTCLYLSHLTTQHSPLLSDPTKNKWVYGGNVLVDPVSSCVLTGGVVLIR